MKLHKILFHWEYFYEVKVDWGRIDPWPDRGLQKTAVFGAWTPKKHVDTVKLRLTNYFTIWSRLFHYKHCIWSTVLSFLSYNTLVKVLRAVSCLAYYSFHFNHDKLFSPSWNHRAQLQAGKWKHIGQAHINMH